MTEQMPEKTSNGGAKNESNTDYERQTLYASQRPDFDQVAVVDKRECGRENGQNN
jgi:hypothetical protein